MDFLCFWQEEYLDYNTHTSAGAKKFLEVCRTVSRWIALLDFEEGRFLRAAVNVYC